MLRATLRRSNPLLPLHCNIHFFWALRDDFVKFTKKFIYIIERYVIQRNKIGSIAPDHAEHIAIKLVRPRLNDADSMLCHLGIPNIADFALWQSSRHTFRCLASYELRMHSIAYPARHYSWSKAASSLLLPDYFQLFSKVHREQYIAAWRPGQFKRAAFIFSTTPENASFGLASLSATIKIASTFSKPGMLGSSFRASAKKVIPSPPASAAWPQLDIVKDGRFLSLMRWEKNCASCIPSQSRTYFSVIL